MRFVSRGLLTACAATLVLGVATAGSAIATLPEFATETTFVGKSGTAIFQTIGGSTWNYTSSLSEGKMTSKNTIGSFIIEFKGGGTFACVNAAKGELVLKNLTGSLGYINKAKKEVGLMLNATTSPLTKCLWAGVSPERELSGHIVIPITPINTKTSTFTLHATQVSGKQNPVSLEGEAANPFAWRAEPKAPFEGLGVEATFTFTTSAQNEIKA